MLQKNSKYFFFFLKKIMCLLFKLYSIRTDSLSPVECLQIGVSILVPINQLQRMFSQAMENLQLSFIIKIDICVDSWEYYWIMLVLWNILKWFHMKTLFDPIQLEFPSLFKNHLVFFNFITVVLRKLYIILAVACYCCRILVVIAIVDKLTHVYLTQTANKRTSKISSTH